MNRRGLVVVLGLGCSMAIGHAVLSRPPSARAHDPGLSSLTLSLHQAGSSAGAQLIVNDADLSGRRRAHAGRCDGEGVFAFTLGQQPLAASVRCTAHDARHTRFEASVAVGSAGALQLTLPLLRELPRGHRCFARVLDASSAVKTERMLDRDAPLVTAEVAAVQAPPSFLVLGVEHILTGFDHLLFLGVLLIGVQGLSRMLKLVTSFTLAHSTTLALATLGWVQVSSAWVETAIAASVVWVAVRNCGAQRALGERLGVTFGFGLIHGLGFASVLRELGVGTSGGSVLMPLLQFNVGVELGQLAIAALALPLLQYVQRAWPERGSRLVSGAAAVVGVVWMVTRSHALWG